MSLAVAAAAGIVALAAWGRTRLQPVRSATSMTRPRRVRRATAQRWAALLDTAASEVRSGSSLTTAWEEARRRHDVIGVAIGRATRLADLAALTVTDDDEAVVAQVVRAAAVLGGPHAATLDAGAALLRERDRVRAETEVHAAQARVSARLLSILPASFAGVNVATSSSFRTAVASPTGRSSVVAGVVLNIAGWCWMRRLVAKASI